MSLVIAPTCHISLGLSVKVKFWAILQTYYKMGIYYFATFPRNSHISGQLTQSDKDENRKAESVSSSEINGFNSNGEMWEIPSGDLCKDT